MKYKALITRMLTMADESIQIIINDAHNFDSLKERINNAFKLCDMRANTQMMRLFEDTDLTSKLSIDEYLRAQHAANLVYPCNNLPNNVDLGNGPQIEFAKNMASGEVLKIFIDKVQSYEDLDSAINEVFSLIDERLVETNNRELEFLEYLRSIPYETQLKVCMIMDILYGRSTKEFVESRLNEQNTGELPNGVYIKRDNTE